MIFHLAVASRGNNVKQLHIGLPPEGGTRSRQPPSSPRRESPLALTLAGPVAPLAQDQKWHLFNFQGAYHKCI